MDFDLCQQYLEGYIEILKEQFNECQLALMKQSKLFPATDTTLDPIDHGLKEFVESQRKYLSGRNDRQLVKFKDNHQDAKLYEALSKCSLTQEQVSVGQYEKSAQIPTDHFRRLILSTD